jgi:hypothetical protein
MVRRNYTPIAVAYRKGKHGKKVYVQEWIDQRTPDKLLNSRTKLLPKDCEILEIGVGFKFYHKYKNKYKS